MIVIKNKKKQKNMTIPVIIIAAMICIYLLFNTINLLRYRGGKPSEILYTSNVKSGIKYDVYLKPNDFITETHISDQYSFISSLVEYVKTTFEYDFAGDNNTPITYDYYVKATVVSKYLSDNATASAKPLWNKEFILLDHKTGSSPNSAFKIMETLDIGIDYYSNLVEAFHQTLNIPLDSRVDITLVVFVDGSNKAKKQVHKEHYLTMSVPLGISVFDIDTSKSFPDQEITYSKEQSPLATSYMLAIIYIVLVIAIIWGVIYYIRAVVNRGQNEYETKVNKILKQYDDRIVTVSNSIRYEKLQIVNIPSFNELLTLSDETLEPIIYWERKIQNNREAWFSIVRDKILYCYVVSYKKNRNTL